MSNIKPNKTSMRINQFIAHHSKYSRREADRLILEGRVNIARTKAQSGDKVGPNARVFIDNKELIIRHKPSTFIVYHKPKGQLVSKKDSLGRELIFDGLDSKFAHFTPVGRLDFSSEGLLILGDDKKIVSSLESSTLLRTYILKISKNITNAMTQAMKNGIHLEDATKGAHALSTIKSMTFSPFASYEIIKSSRNYSRIKVSIYEGQNRELRRFFAHFGADVLDLRRISFGFVSLNSLPVGKWRYFTRQEYKNLHAFLKSSRA